MYVNGKYREPLLYSVCALCMKTLLYTRQYAWFGRVVISVHLLRVTTYFGAHKELFNELTYLPTYLLTYSMQQSPS
jgi:hypothetical protein